MTTETTKNDSKMSLATERVNNLRKSIADSLCRIQGDLDLFKYSCEQMEWNDDVCYEINDACAKLGFSLATLVTWFDD